VLRCIQDWAAEQENVLPKQNQVSFCWSYEIKELLAGKKKTKLKIAKGLQNASVVPEAL